MDLTQHEASRHPSMAGAAHLEIRSDASRVEIATELMRTGAHFYFLVYPDGAKLMRLRGAFIRNRDPRS